MITPLLVTFQISSAGVIIREKRASILTQIRIGKSSTAHVTLDDELVARIHCIVEQVEPGQLVVIDMGSTLGTHVNGQRVRKGRLVVGDTLLLGGTSLKITAITAEGAPEKQSPLQNIVDRAKALKAKATEERKQHAQELSDSWKMFEATPLRRQSLSNLLCFFVIALQGDDPRHAAIAKELDRRFPVEEEPKDN